MGNRLSETWIKASIAGTMWAASEIVLGSFLHNLKVPFSGNILTAIGIIILISIGHIWRERGLFWRAGLVCAVMKSMSPSAVIFGPMIAIFTESLLLEFSVRLMGRSYAAYITGSVLAMSWNLIQKIINYIIFYGTNIIEVYTSLLKYAQKQLNIGSDIVWMPIIILLAAYALFGLLASITGIRVGRKMLERPVQESPVTLKMPSPGTGPGKRPEFNYSMAWLIADAALIIFSFLLLNLTGWIIWAPAIAIIVIIWSVRYKRALRQLSRPKFWFLFVFITLVAAFVFTKAGHGENSLMKGLLTGIQMNFRAVVVIVGFSVLGTELYNPVVRNFFLGTSFKNLPLALELSAESLPLFIANIPDFRSLIRNPVALFYTVISNAESRLSEIRKRDSHAKEVFIVTGSIRGGKTTFTRKLCDLLKGEDITTGGILSERVMKDGETTGYDIADIFTGERFPFLRQEGQCGEERIGRFIICSDGLSEGRRILGSLAGSGENFAVIDEVGLLELQGKGWSDAITVLLGEPQVSMLMTVRDIYVDEVRKKWDLTDAVVFNITGTDQNDAFRSIISKIQRTGSLEGEAVKEPLI